MITFNPVDQLATDRISLLQSFLSAVNRYNDFDPHISRWPHCMINKLYQVVRPRSPIFGLILLWTVSLVWLVSLATHSAQRHNGHTILVSLVDALLSRPPQIGTDQLTLVESMNDCAALRGGHLHLDLPGARRNTVMVGGCAWFQRVDSLNSLSDDDVSKRAVTQVSQR